ncbi:MAG: hypothetical protein NT083_01025 [Rhodocyclales bacterium]|nr:hypothetical protein [Rhodocyclales bacterium]
MGGAIGGMGAIGGIGAMGGMGGMGGMGATGSMGATPAANFSMSIGSGSTGATPATSAARTTVTISSGAQKALAANAATGSSTVNIDVSVNPDMNALSQSVSDLNALDKALAALILAMLQMQAHNQSAA